MLMLTRCKAFGALGPTSSSYTPVGYSIASTFQSLLSLFSSLGTRVSERSFCSGQFRYGAAAPYFALCFAVGDRRIHPQNFRDTHVAAWIPEYRRSAISFVDRWSD